MELRYCITLAGLLAAFGVSAAACGDDDNGTESGATTSGSGTTSGTGGGGTGGGDGGGGSDNNGGGGAAPSSSLISDDFESYAAQGAPGGKWKVYTALEGSAVTVDTAQAYSGTQSVKVTTPATTAEPNYKSAMIQFTGDALPVEGNVIRGRMMFYLESAPTTDVHWTFIDGSGIVPGSDYEGAEYSAVYRYGGQKALDNGNQMMANYDTPGFWADPKTAPQTDCWHHAEGVVVPTGKWTCVEFSFDGPKNEMRLWLDGQEVDKLTMSGTGQGCVSEVENFTWSAPEFTSIGFGWESYQADAARTMWIDDVVIGTEPIGCPPAP
ncbi:hypothetical protein [Sorangium sp. So ce131]|uniref:hypothetical protein n=1 Tax=Sorangium sp. So ce131 TaxID=3133282 RepID=UPI003F5DC72B